MLVLLSLGFRQSFPQLLHANSLLVLRCLGLTLPSKLQEDIILQTISSYMGIIQLGVRELSLVTIWQIL